MHGSQFVKSGFTNCKDGGDAGRSSGRGVRSPGLQGCGGIRPWESTASGPTPATVKDDFETWSSSRRTGVPYSAWQERQRRGGGSKAGWSPGSTARSGQEPTGATMSRGHEPVRLGGAFRVRFVFESSSSPPSRRGIEHIDVLRPAQDGTSGTDRKRPLINSAASVEVPTAEDAGSATTDASASCEIVPSGRSSGCVLRAARPWAGRTCWIPRRARWHRRSRGHLPLDCWLASRSALIR